MNTWLRILLLNTYLFSLPSLYSQPQSSILIRGIITNKQDQPIPYVNIGVVGKNAGTVSDAKGAFSLEIEGNFWQTVSSFLPLAINPKPKV